MKLYLVDVSSWIFRAYYAFRGLNSPTGMPTNAIFGFVNMCSKLMLEKKPDYLAFCYDLKEPSFRKALDPNYKANRTEMPEDLVPQIPWIKKYVQISGIPSFECAGYEADDVIGTLTKWGQINKIEVVIVSGDKDFCQLIAPGVVLYDPMKEQVTDEQKVAERYGVRPDQFIDYLALIGDSSDNVPGVEGVGPKGAVKLLSQLGSLDEIYKQLHLIANEKLRQKLHAGQEDAFLSRKLVTIVTDVPMTISLEGITKQPADKMKLQEFFRELNFKSLEKKEIEQQGGEQHESPTSTPSTTSTPSASTTPSTISTLSIDEFHKHISQNEKVWVVPTDQGLSLLKNSGGNHSIFILKGDPLLLGQLSDQFNIHWLGYDLKSFFHLIQPAKTSNLVYDLMIAGYLVHPGQNLQTFSLAVEFFLQKTLQPLSEVELYVDLCFELRTFLSQRIEHLQLSKVLNEIENPLVGILYQMEKRGIGINEEILLQFGKELFHDQKHLEAEIHELAGENFNVASPKQLGQILFEKLKLPAKKKIKTGYSTDSDVLEALDHPICAKILEYREIAKLKGTYVDPLIGLARQGRVHTTFHQALTSTGRLSSSDPNMQNLPIRTVRGSKIRQAIVGGVRDDGGSSDSTPIDQSRMKILSADYSQIELRILAHITQDPGLCTAFAENKDIHAATAALVFNVNESEVTPQMRRTAKAVNFGIAYGQGAFGLAENLKISRSEATTIINNYFARFARVQQYIFDTIESAKSCGYVETLFGRRRYLPELKSSNANLRKFGERAAINAPIQGSASDIVKLAMIACEKVADASLILQVHDELVFEVLDESPVHNLVDKMENIVSLKVPLKVTAAVGDNWSQAH